MTRAADLSYEPATQLEHWARARPDAVAIRAGEDTTYRELDVLAKRVSAALRRDGVGPGDRVFVLTRSPRVTYALLHGAAGLGAVMVPANWRLSSDELTHVLDDCRPALVLVDAHLESALPDPGTGAARVVIDTADAGSLEGWLAEPPGADAAPSLGQDRTVLQIYTSGTSGDPKGVLLTVGNLAEKVHRMRDEWRFAEDSVSLLATPLFHVGGLSWGLISLAAGASLVLPARTNGAALLDLIVDLRVTHAFLVPKMLSDLVAEAAQRPPEDYPLESIVCGAAPVGVDLQRQAVDLLGCRLFQVYGLTETTGAVTQLDVGQALDTIDPTAALRSSGRPYPWVEIVIRDPESCQPVPDGTTGEIWIRTRQNCLGYWNRPEETSRLIDPQGWLRTGDGGFLDADGRVHITDRLKDMIVSGGENIYSVEVERALQSHPAVLDVAVVGRPDTEWGEVVVAVIEQRPGTEIDLEGAADHVGHRLGRYKRPRELLVVERLPRNSTGKILKREVRQLVAAHQRREA